MGDITIGEILGLGGNLSVVAVIGILVLGLVTQALYIKKLLEDQIAEKQKFADLYQTALLKALEDRDD